MTTATGRINETTTKTSSNQLTNQPTSDNKNRSLWNVSTAG